MVMNRFVAAAAGGFLATVPMTIAMVAIQRTQRRPRSPLPPKEVTRKTLKEAGMASNLRGKALQAATWVSHFAYGAAAGACYPLVRRLVPIPPVLKGPGFGLAVWALSYIGWLPATGILRPPQKQTPNRNVALIVSHLIWGAATKAIFHRLRALRLR
jgi:uncharacterized membrane protein YagU involved in acid resistance